MRPPFFGPNRPSYFKYGGGGFPQSIQKISVETLVQNSTGLCCRYNYLYTYYACFTGNAAKRRRVDRAMDDLLARLSRIQSTPLPPRPPKKGFNPANPEIPILKDYGGNRGGTLPWDSRGGTLPWDSRGGNLLWGNEKYRSVTQKATLSFKIV